MKGKCPGSESHSVISNSFSPWDSPGQNTGMSSLSLLQGIFSTQGPNPGLPHCRKILYQLSHKGSPRILEWVANPFSRGSSWPRNQTQQCRGLLHCRQTLYQLSHHIKEPSKSVVVVYSLSCVQLYSDPKDYRRPGPSVHGISQARILEWVAISFSSDQSLLVNSQCPISSYWMTAECLCTASPQNCLNDFPAPKVLGFSSWA